MKKLGAALAMLVVCAGPAVAAKPPKNGQPNPNLTIKASATAVTFGRTVTLSGNAKGLPAGSTLSIQQNPYPYTGFKDTGRTTVVQPDGNWSASGLAPQAHTQYRVQAKTSPPTESASVFVRVRLRVSFRVSDSTPKKGTRVRFFGTVAPAHPGKPVLIQKKTSSGYRTVSTATLSSTSTYSKRIRIRRNGTYRVVAQSVDEDHDNGTSRSRTLRVH